MKFASFEEALKICMTAANGSPEQEAAMTHCLQTAPPELQAMLSRRLTPATNQITGGHDHRPGCGCGEQQD